MNKNRLKKPMVALVLATSIGIPCVSAPGSVLAAENTAISVNENVKVGITDVQSEVKKIGEYYYANNYAGKKVEHRRYAQRPDSVTTTLDFNIKGNVNNLTFDNVIVEYIGENEFINNTNETQKFTTAKYTKSVTETIATATTNGFNVGGSSNLFNIPIVLNNGLTVNAGFNSSTTETQTKAEQKTIEASAQTVEVPPHKKYKAEVVLEQRNYKGDVGFTGLASFPFTTIKTTASYTAPNGMIDSKKYSFGKWTGEYYSALTKEQKNSIKGLTFKEIPQAFLKLLEVNGTGKVNGVFGSKLTVHFYDITDKSNPKLVETRSFE